MTDLFTAAMYAIAIGGLVYAVLEGIEISSAIRGGPPKPSTGVESAKGQKADVSKAFVRSSSGAAVGRVSFEGEDWRAEYVGESSTLPTVGERVTIREIDSGRLTARVE